MKRIRLALAALALPLALCGGCVRYYRVTDPVTNHVYYTRDVDRRDSGAREFMDAQTKAEVTLQSSIVERITKEEFVKWVGRD